MRFKIASTLGLMGALALGGCVAGEIEGSQNTRYDSLGRVLGPVTTAIVLRAERSGDPVPLARIEVRHNEMVEFYAMPESGVLVSGTGRPDDGTALARVDVPAKEAWETLSQNHAMPQALATALSRVSQRVTPAVHPVAETVAPNRDSSQVVEVPIDDGELALGESSSTASAKAFCSSDNGGYYGTWAGECSSEFPFDTKTICYDNVIGTSSTSYNDVRNLYANVCPRSGSLIAKVSADEGGPKVGTWTVAKDTYRYWSYQDWDCGRVFDACPYIKLQVTTANVVYNLRFLVGD